jgi:hypothetical protein
MHRRDLFALGAVTLVAAALLLLFKPAASSVAHLYPAALPPHPYFVPEHALLLYVELPLAVLSAVVLLLAPGVFAVLAAGGETRVAPLLLKGFVAAFGIHFCVTSLAKGLGLTLLHPSAFLALLLASGAGSFGFLALRVARGSGVSWPLTDPAERRRLYRLAAVPLITVVALLPVIFWQDLNEDGVEAYEIGRSLASHQLPRFPNGSGFMGLGIGMIPMAYPNHWFDRLFGSSEAAPRLPIALYLPILAAALLALIELRSPRRLGDLEDTVVLACIAAFTVAMGYNASYDTYFADLSSPATFEALTALLVVGMAYFLWSGQAVWFVCVATLTYLARPTGLLMLPLLGLGSLALPPDERRRCWRLLAVAMVVCVALLIAYERLWVRGTLGTGRYGYPTAGIIHRFRYIRLDDVSRLFFLLVPGGILPALSLFAFRRQDPVARALVIATLAYFTVFYFPAFTNMHHFVPAMVLPIAVMGRVALFGPERMGRTVAALAAALLAVAVSLPRHAEVNRTFRQLGQATVYRIGDYDGSYEDHRRAINGRALLDSLFKPTWDVKDPSRELVGGLQLLYYATRPKANPDSVNYVVQVAEAPAPAGFSLVTSGPKGAAYVRDLDLWALDRSRGQTTDYRSAIYEIPRETQFNFLGISAGRYTFDLRRLLPR